MRRTKRDQSAASEKFPKACVMLLNRSTATWLTDDKTLGYTDTRMGQYVGRQAGDGCVCV